MAKAEAKTETPEPQAAPLAKAAESALKAFLKVHQEHKALVAEKNVDPSKGADAIACRARMGEARLVLQRALEALDA